MPWIGHTGATNVRELEDSFSKKGIDTSEQGCRKAYKGDVIYERSVPVTRDPIHESKV